MPSSQISSLNAEAVFASKIAISPLSLIVPSRFAVINGYSSLCRIICFWRTLIPVLAVNSFLTIGSRRVPK